MYILYIHTYSNTEIIICLLNFSPVRPEALVTATVGDDGAAALREAFLFGSSQEGAPFRRV